MPEERRKEYKDLSETKVILATLIERLDNVISLFEHHQADDVKVAERVSGLEKREAFLSGKIFAISAICGAASAICGAAVLFISKLKIW